MEEKMKMFKSIVGLAIIVAVFSLGLSYKAHSQIMETANTLKAHIQKTSTSSSSFTYVWSADGKCYNQYLSEGQLRCDSKEAIPYPGTKGLCIAPYVDPKATFCK
jgi:hypothetical protein